MTAVVKCRRGKARHQNGIACSWIIISEADVCCSLVSRFSNGRLNRRVKTACLVPEYFNICTHTTVGFYLVRTNSHACKPTWHAIDDDCNPFYIFPWQTEQHITVFPLNWASHARSIWAAGRFACKHRLVSRKTICVHCSAAVCGEVDGMKASLSPWFRNKQAMHLIITLNYMYCIALNTHKPRKSNRKSTEQVVSCVPVVCVNQWNIFDSLFECECRARVCVQRLTAPQAPIKSFNSDM